MSAAPPRFLIVTDRRQARLPLETVAELAFAAGCPWLLLRDKDLFPEARRLLGTTLLNLSRAHCARLSVSGDAALAAEIGADGLHLPADGDVAAARAALGPEALIGLSAHDLAEAERAADAGADYVTLSPIFWSRSKPRYGPALGLKIMAEIARDLPIPLYALGGVTPANAARAIAAGAAGVAVMGEAMRAEDPGALVAELAAACAAG